LYCNLYEEKILTIFADFVLGAMMSLSGVEVAAVAQKIVRFLHEENEDHVLTTSW